MPAAQEAAKMGAALGSVIGVAGVLATVLLLVALAVSLRKRRYSSISNGGGSSSAQGAADGLKDVTINFLRLGFSIDSSISAVQPALDVGSSLHGKMENLKFWKKSSHTPALVGLCSSEGGDSYHGKISFALSYDKENFALHVELLEAVDLPALDLLSGSSDPYVRVFLLPDREEMKVSKVKRRTLNPKFNETLVFRGHPQKKLHDMTVCMQLMDYDRFTHDDPIGEILLPLKDVKFEKRPVYWKHLQEPTVQHREVRGELMLSICYTPEFNRLTVVVVKAKDLPTKDISGTADPYVKLWLVHQGNKWEKRKTTVKNQNLSPIFNETFSFTVTKERIQETQLVASVMDRDIIGSNDEIGHIILGKRGSDTGQKHWKEICDKPTQPVTMWHKLSPRW